MIYKGEPVAGADLTFISEGKKRSAFARTDETIILTYDIRTE